MVFCSECGEQVPGGAKFCSGCGKPVAAGGSAPKVGTPSAQAENILGGPVGGGGAAAMTSDTMTGVTGAVRSYAANASEEEKEKKYGQQKWGLFETNYQRNKKITTEESLQEIEEFCGGGGAVPGRMDGSGSAGGRGGSAGSAGSAGYGSSSGGGGGGFEIHSSSSSSAGRAGGGAGGGSAGFGSTQRGTAGGGTQHFGPGGNAGDSFFSQHQQNEKKKYMPQHSLNK
eukprot:TRINITY_DN5364_c0_g1_i1.p2 TRINITY_DN5364_c0_g1~~TRINITY_DN5364_c0_g1_i1.p2  ORF type:complete len:228 (-),score=80.97 TRINITY_DN5364_c0_g1_i1:256-939(-)